MNIFMTQFYINSPLNMQECIISLQGLAFKLLREGLTFKGALSSLEKSQYYSREELRELQSEKLKLIIKHSYENVPYYRRLFKELSLTPADFKNVHDLKKLPFISKQNVKNNPEDFLAVNIKKLFTRKIFTSGTTGSPLKLYRDLHSINFERAIIKREQSWAGFDLGDRKVILRSSPIVPSNVKRPPFWRKDLFQKSLFISAYHLSKENIAYYFNEIKKYKPVALETVPSAGYLMAKLLRCKGLKLDFKYVFTSSEVLMPHQKKFMEKEFGTRVIDHYGTAERVSSIGMCEKGSYHIYPEDAVTELVPLKGREGSFEIAGTTLNNFAMPLLRYKTGDIVTLSSEKCLCGRNFERIKSIDGRKTDNFFITKDGRHISLLSGMLSIDLNNVIETQLIQEDIGKIRVKVVTGDRYSDSDESRLRKSIKNFLGDDINIQVEKVASISRTDGGKFKQFISEVTCPTS